MLALGLTKESFQLTAAREIGHRGDLVEGDRGIASPSAGEPEPETTIAAPARGYADSSKKDPLVEKGSSGLLAAPLLLPRGSGAAMAGCGSADQDHRRTTLTYFVKMYGS